MSFLYFLENLRNPVLDFIFSLITLFGEETIFMAVGMIVFWCVDKHKGYFLLCVGFLGTVLNQFLKILCRVPRPWIRNPDFTVVESAKEAAGGYSFPSGHTQTAVGLYGGVARITAKTWLRIAMIILALLVGLSRMYLGVHTPADVLVSLGIATVLIFVAYPLFRKAEHSPKVMYGILFSLLGIVIGYLCFVLLFPFPADVYAVDAIDNLNAAHKNGFTLLGCSLGMIAVYTVDRKWTNFETKAVWWAQILKVIGGLLLVVAVKELLKAPLDALFAGHLIARTVRYLLMVVVGGILWPMTFRYFAKLGKRKVWKHFKTITRHRWLVRGGCFRVGLYWQGLTHDLSKYSPTEFGIGARYFQGDKSPNAAERTDKGYSEAWMHHKGRNRHHYEYWTDMNRQSRVYEPVHMPRKYLIEQVMDRRAACMVYQGKNYTDESAYVYFMASRERELMHPDNRRELEFLLDMLAKEGEKQTFSYIKRNILKGKPYPWEE